MHCHPRNLSAERVAPSQHSPVRTNGTHCVIICVEKICRLPLFIKRSHIHSCLSFSHFFFAARSLYDVLHSERKLTLVFEYCDQVRIGLLRLSKSFFFFSAFVGGYFGRVFLKQKKTSHLTQYETEVEESGEVNYQLFRQKKK